ncbi:(d)CMP kinase [Lederbergia citrea]|uniref:Cytidylate kinase n=1 Tax=Lederbergia citrea TaxID=2833581 RepID=A0A942UNZ4_9BACI|nr:(d)CMP kinase [Lederbergia citrea]MBS4176549.1 (d)CMP kinase [Lederbergia citrea]MBS4222218.1 (d)CMP kinase [Lederbergia citrea]
MNNKKISIAIDGPAAAGKSTIAKITAEKLSYIYVDTGAMYRAITYKALKSQIDIQNEKEIEQLLLETSIELKPSNSGQLVFLDGEDVTEKIREEQVTNLVSTIAASGPVREEMVYRQQQLGKDGGVVMDGRDIGTKVLPHAELKIFMLASVDVRAERRHLENTRKGYSSNLEKLKEEIELRDKLDSEREISPLRKAEDAVEIDTSFLSIEEVAAEIYALAQERMEDK